MIKLTDRHVIVVIPVATLIVRYVEAPVIAQQDMASIARINPHRMVIDMHVPRGVLGLKRLPTVPAQIEFRAKHPNVIDVGRIDANLAVIHRTRIQAVNTLPGYSAVVRLIDPAVFMGGGTLLQVLVLTTQPARVLTACPRAFFLRDPPARTTVFFRSGILGQCKLQIHALAFARNGQPQNVTHDVLVDGRLQFAIRQDRAAIG